MKETMGAAADWRGELKATLRLAGPIVAGNVGQILIGVVDTVMIARVGVAELGAAAFVNNLFMVPLVALIGLLAAVPVLVSQAKGAGDAAQVGRHFKHALALTLAVSLLAFALLGLNALALDRYGQPPEVIAVSRSYYWLIIASLVPGLLYQCLKCVSEGLGWSQPPMAILLSGIALNAVLNWVLIFGKLGFPQLGLEGAGIATLIARTLIAVGMLAFALRAPRFAPYLPGSWWRRYRWADFLSVLRIGVPTAGQHLFEVGAFAASGVMIGWISTEALAAHQVAISCAALAFMFPLGVSIACGIQVGEAYGAGAIGRIKAVCLGSIGFTIAQTATVALCFLLAGTWLAELFVDDEAVIAVASSIFVIVGLFQIFDGTQVNALGALRGLSDVNIPVMITFCAYWLVALPTGYALGFGAGFGAVGVWSGLAVGLAFSAVCLLFRLRLILGRRG